MTITGASEIIPGKFRDKGGAVWNVKHPDFGAAGDEVLVLDGVMTSGVATLTSATAAFVVGDVGKAIVVTGAGAPTAGSGTLTAAAGVGTFSLTQACLLADGAIVIVAGTAYTVSSFNNTTGCVLSGTPTFGASAFTIVTDLTTTISARTNGTTVTLTASAGRTVSAASVNFPRTTDTAAFNAAISAAILTKGKVFIPDGRYAIDAALNLTGANGLTFEFASGAVLHQWTSTAHGFTGSCSSVRFERPTIVGPMSIGIALGPCNDITIIDADISGGVVRESSGLFHCGGIRLLQANGVLIRGGKFYNNGNVVTPGVDVKGTDVQVGEDGNLNYNVRVLHTNCTSTKVKSNIALFDAKIFTVFDNTCAGAKTIGTSGGYGVVVYESGGSGNLRDGVVAKNRIKDTEGSGIYLQTVIHGDCEGNVVEHCGTLQTASVLVVGNIAVSNCTNVRVRGGALRSAGYDGVVVAHVSTATYGCSVEGVDIEGAAAFGIRYQGVIGDLTIRGNTVKDATLNGISNNDNGGATDPVDHVLIDDNIVRNAGAIAIGMFNPTNSSVLDNIVKGAGKQGVSMGSGTGTLNKIEHNNISGANGLTGFDDIFCSSGSSDVRDNICAGTITLSGAGTRQLNNRATTITLSGGAASQITGDTSGLMVLTDAAGTDFKRLHFGGSTASFPAIRRSTTSMDAVLADNSAYTRWNARHFSTQGGSFLGSLATVAYSASMTPDASLGNLQAITATNGTAFTINAPSNPTTGQRLRVKIKNTSGGALGVATWNAVFKLGAAWVQPANGFSRTIEFDNDGTNWVETFRSAADVAN